MESSRGVVVGLIAIVGREGGGSDRGKRWV